MVNFTQSAQETWSIQVVPDFDPRPTQLPNYPFQISQEDLKYLNTINLSRQLESVYQLRSTQQTPPEEIDSVSGYFFYPPEYSIVVEDFIKLANVQEVLYEVVPNVMVRQTANKKELRVYFDDPLAKTYETLILLDGIPITDPGPLLALPPDRIKSIDVKNKIYILGNNIFSAIVNFNSPNRDYAGLNLPDQSVLSTLALPLISHDSLPDVNQSAKHIPVLSSTLFWSSLAGSEAQFQSNDLTGAFSIHLFGYKQGKWIFESTIINVTNK